MPCSFRWGETFLAIEAEFWPWQVEEIRLDAYDKIDRAPRSRKLEREGIQASVIPFEKFEYGFVLQRHGKEWTLEVASLPPHARLGERARKARRVRERAERKARQNRVSLRNALIIGKASAKRILFKQYKKLNRLRLNLAALFQQVRKALAARQLTIHEELLSLITPSREICRSSSIAAWVEGANIAFGQRMERRWFGEDIGFPIRLSTFAPIEVVFVLGGASIFGERALESEWIS